MEKIDIERIYGDTEKLNSFYTNMSAISEMAVSKYANLLLENIIIHSAKWAHEHEDALRQLIAMGADFADKATKPESTGALDKEAQEKQEASRDCQDAIPAGCPDVDCTGVYNTD